MKQLITILLVVLTCGSVAHAQVASNPPYTLDQSVIAGGGGTSTGMDTATGGTLTLDGALGQPAAGTTSRGANLALTSGFFTAAPVIIPTAATAFISGQVIRIDGRPLSGVRLSLTGGALQTPVTTVTDREGNFTFPDLELNVIYLINATRKNFSFTAATTSTQTHAISLVGDQPGVIFIGTPRGRTFGGRVRQ
ncbi:MAG: carboxypeptidase-like regulatory domain-containing protein [Pyrinomonadaceae bacterium MAG19_C2-C3]|nr:carboxypeptidase-like regulatory domain-containing protein [Pyrinomonadaceae bacterium MAG19_C2-C3]